MKLISCSVLILFILSLSDSYSQWSQVGQTSRGEYITNISAPDSNTVWISWIDPDYNSKIIRTTNGGQNWDFVNTPSNGYFITCTQGINSLTAFAAGGFSNPASMYKTTDGGSSWNIIAEITGDEAYFDEIAFSKSNPQFGFAAGDVNSVFHLFKTTDGGNVWTKSIIPSEGLAPQYLSGFAIDETFFGFQIWLGNENYKSYITSNGGVSWITGDSILVGTGGIAFSDNKTDGIMTMWDGLPIYKASTDGGITWNNKTLNSNLPSENYPVWVTGTNTVFISTKYEIFRSDNGGNNWTMQYHDTTDEVLHIDYARYGNTIVAYAICYNGKILKSRQSVTTGIQNISFELPSEYSLSQNYPNPFNPSTKISFAILKNGQVTLRVFDISGRLTSELANETLPAGSYEYDFDGSNLSSGTYFYELKAADFKEVKRMVLVK